ncbi:longitudinals lacking protein, isoforms A/B/D/L-like [Homalodisca vitripennis]|uniref:longitudinals lacking protein, isoforms A/B/D/L-like n=1 Tax=Homalodisca vitripennis TaxID=197043 RepID=UPI001EECDE1B|nr:longitudinals lacking protein, isoforms A/B/D/L-like [Homalodisca vitripennis]
MRKKSSRRSLSMRLVYSSTTTGSGASLRMTVGRYACSRCPRTYAHKGDLTRHSKQECGVEPMFSCPYCLHRSHRKANLKIHVNLIHKLPA